MRCGKANEFSGRDDLCLFPEFREMLLIAWDEVGGTSFFGAFSLSLSEVLSKFLRAE
jgi:hypothetical protein